MVNDDGGRIKNMGDVSWGRCMGRDNELATFECDSKFKQLDYLASLKMSVSDNRNQFLFPELRKEKNLAYETFKCTRPAAMRLKRLI